MAVDSFADAMAQVAKVIEVLDDRDADLVAMVGQKDVINQAAAGDFVSEQADALLVVEEQLRANVYGTGPAALLGPFLNDVTLAIEGAATTPAQQLVEIRDYMAANSQSVNTRTMSYGSFSYGGSNVGDTVAYQVTVDRHGSALQGAYAETPVIRCIQDQYTGARRNASIFQYEGDASRASVIDGSGLRRNIECVYDGVNLLRNPRFTSFSSGAPAASSNVNASSTTAWSNWVIGGTAANLAASVDQRNRYSTTTEAYKSVYFNSNDSIYQTFADRGAIFNREVPYLFGVLCYKATGADGTLTIAWGSKSQAFTVSSSISDNSWGWLIVDRDVDLYYDSFKQNEVRFTVTLASQTTPGLYMQEAIVAPGTLINGTYYWLLSKTIPGEVGDTATQTISQSANGVNQRWLSQRLGLSDELGYAFSLPSSGSPTIADA